MTFLPRALRHHPDLLERSAWELPGAQLSCRVRGADGRRSGATFPPTGQCEQRLKRGEGANCPVPLSSVRQPP